MLARLLGPASLMNALADSGILFLFSGIREAKIG